MARPVFNNLDEFERIIENFNLGDDPSQISNRDETCMQLSPQFSKVSGQDATRNKVSRCSLQRTSVNNLDIINAAETAMPLYRVFKRKTIRSVHSCATNYASFGTSWTLKDDIDVEWFEKVLGFFPEL
ncbi:hypothetical protein RRG08_052225 [Elysia crispata]|uniref:Uncharacterized protein n=1 Tax=Elysia crispata TaxID=231223 RepID=A0AAE0ZZE3_9GAST|nr:hypothetical protein RRG08_052225 [Elysia crispata]